MALALIRFFVFCLILSVALHLIRSFLRRIKAERPIARCADPYAVLGVSPQATKAEIKGAYHRKLAEYHPDKVAQLGEDLQRLAQTKTAEIIQAYKSLQ